MWNVQISYCRRLNFLSRQCFCVFTAHKMLHLHIYCFLAFEVPWKVWCLSSFQKTCQFTRNALCDWLKDQPNCCIGRFSIGLETRCGSNFKQWTHNGAPIEKGRTVFVCWRAVPIRIWGVGFVYKNQSSAKTAEIGIGHGVFTRRMFLV